MRIRVMAKVADGRYSSDLGESHYAALRDPSVRPG